MNRFFLALAATITSGTFAVAYVKEWVNLVLGKEIHLKPSKEINYPYFHNSEDLYRKVVLIIAIVFSLLFFATVWFVLKKKWGMVFFCFTLSMLAILAVMVNGAIK